MVWPSVHVPFENSDHCNAHCTESTFSNQDMRSPPFSVAETRGYRLPFIVDGRENSGVEHPRRNRDRRMYFFIFYQCFRRDASLYVSTYLFYHWGPSGIPYV